MNSLSCAALTALLGATLATSALADGTTPPAVTTATVAKDAKVAAVTQSKVKKTATVSSEGANDTHTSQKVVAGAEGANDMHAAGH